MEYEPWFAGWKRRFLISIAIVAGFIVFVLMDSALLSFLRDYGWVLFSKYWWPLIPGFLLAIVDMYSKYSKRAIPFEGKVVLWVFVAGLIFCQSWAYRDLKGKTEGLYGEFGNIMSGFNYQTQHTFTVMDISVNNTGNPTFVKNYRLHVQFGPIDRWFNPTAIPPVGMTAVGGTNNRPRFKLMPEDQISEKTLTPIQPGGGEHGFLLYDLGDINLESLARAEVTWTVTFQDIYKHTYSVAKTATNYAGVPISGPAGGIYQFYFFPDTQLAPPGSKAK